MTKLTRTFVLALGTAMFVGLAAAGYVLTRKPAVAPPADIKVAMTPERIARGRYIFELADCDGCHSERDFSRFAGPVVESGRGKGVVFPAELGLPGHITAGNITTDRETGIGAWTDGEKIRAIREGVSRDGSPLFTMMPYERFRHMSDEDVYSLVAYLNTLPPVRNEVPTSRIDFPVSIFMKDAPQPVGKVPPPVRADRVKYGEYLVTMAGCQECHTRSRKGKPIPTLLFAGGEPFRYPFAMVVSANITPDPQTGIGRWSEQDFLDRFYQYREYADKGSPQVGPDSFTLMPWLTLAKLPPDDLKAIYAFLRAQHPVYHIVDSHPETLVSQIRRRKSVP